MGLDIYHYKMIPPPGEGREKAYIKMYLRDLLPSVVRRYGLDRIAYGVPAWDTHHRLSIFPDLRSKDIAIEKRLIRPYETEGVHWLLGTVASCADQVRELEEKLGLDSTRASRHDLKTYEPDRTTMEFGETIYWSRTVTVMGSYVEEVGYQRKGMIPEFRREYFQDFHYPEYSRFLALPSYLDFEDDEDDGDFYKPYMENLRKNFIDNYEEGRSLLYYQS